MTGAVCIVTDPSLSASLDVGSLTQPNQLLHFYPEPDLIGAAIIEFVDWAEWARFAVLYHYDSDVEKYKVLLQNAQPEVFFRQVQPLDRNETYQILYGLRRKNVFRYLIDMPVELVTPLLLMTSVANITGMSYSFLHIGWISEAEFNGSVSTFLFSGSNFTSLQLSGLGPASSYALQLRPQAYLEMELTKLLSSSSIRSSSSSSSSSSDSLMPKLGIVEPLTINLTSLSGAVCNVTQMADTAAIAAALQNEIAKSNGYASSSPRRTGLKAGRSRSLNFTFDVYHLYTDGMQKYAKWSADTGFQSVAGANKKQIERFEKFLRQRNLSVVSVEDPPFSIYRERDSEGRPLHGNDRWTGFAIELFKEIANRVHLTYSIHKSSDGKFGSPIDSSSGSRWTGMIGELIQGSAHVAVASLTITYDREKVVDFTTPYMSLGLSVIMKKSKQEPDLFQFLLPFSNRVWLYMLLAWLLAALVMFICARVSPYEWYAPSGCDPIVQNQFNALNSIWFTIGSLMQQGSDLAPRASSTRIVGTVWWFFTLILISSYTANLAAFLTVTRLNDIKSIEDLAEQTNIKYGTLLGGSTYNFFKNADIQIYKNMWQSMVEWNAKNDSFMLRTADGIERVRQGGYAYILESTFNTFYRERDCSLMQVGSIFNPKSYAFGVSQGSIVLRDILTEEILHLQKEQFIEKLTEKWLKRYNVTKPCSELARSRPPTGTLDVDAIGGVFVSLLLGLCIGLIISVVELLIHSTTNACRKKTPCKEEMNKQLKLAFTCCSCRSKKDRGEIIDYCTSPIHAEQHEASAVWSRDV